MAPACVTGASVVIGKSNGISVATPTCGVRVRARYSRLVPASPSRLAGIVHALPSLLPLRRSHQLQSLSFCNTAPAPAIPLATSIIAHPLPASLFHAPFAHKTTAGCLNDGAMNLKFE